MHTPRTPRALRGTSTLTGNGWLRESPRNYIPRGWEARGKSALRKCMFLPVPQHLRELLPPPSALPPRAPSIAPAPARAPEPVVPHRRDPRKDVRMFREFELQGGVHGGVDAYAPSAPAPSAPLPSAPLPSAPVPRKADAPVRGSKSSAWWEDPIALGSLLVIAPPIGLAALWSSERYSRDARWALTLVTALMMSLACAVAIALVLR